MSNEHFIHEAELEGQEKRAMSKPSSPERVWLDSDPERAWGHRTWYDENIHEEMIPYDRAVWTQYLKRINAELDAAEPEVGALGD